MALRHSTVLMLATACLVSGCVLTSSSEASPQDAVSRPPPPEDTQPAATGGSRRYAERIPLT
jgi:hypothetical protein